MTKVISRRGISYHLEEIIRTAQKRITIVTPYLKIPDALYERLVSADKRNIDISFVYGKSKLNRVQEQKMKALSNCKIYYKENLHAKVYLNEHSGIICSMNLYDYSEINNSEIGVYFERQEGANCLCTQTEHEVQQIIEYADVIKGSREYEERRLITDFVTKEATTTINNFPLEYMELNHDYGFVTYVFKRDITNLYSLSRKLTTIFSEKMPRYRIFWKSPYDRIFVYAEKNIGFESIEDEIEYYVNGIMGINTILKKHIHERNSLKKRISVAK